MLGFNKAFNNAGLPLGNCFCSSRPVGLVLENAFFCECIADFLVLFGCSINVDFTAENTLGIAIVLTQYLDALLFFSLRSFTFGVIFKT